MTRFLFEDSKVSKAAKWFINKIKGLRKRDAVGNDIDMKKIKSLKDFTKKLRLGYIYTHVYDAKLKDKLEYWDRVPLFTPAKIMSDRILGFNFHYLPPKQREAFLNDYYNFLLNNAKTLGFVDLSEVPHSQISSWGKDYITDVYLMTINSPGNMLQQCVKIYLYSHIMSRITPIEIEEWDNVTNLILPDFQKKSASYIYKDVKENFKKYKDNTRKNIYRL